MTEIKKKPILIWDDDLELSDFKVIEKIQCNCVFCKNA